MPPPYYWDATNRRFPVQSGSPVTVGENDYIHCCSATCDPLYSYNFFDWGVGIAGCGYTYDNWPYWDGREYVDPGSVCSPAITSHSVSLGPSGGTFSFTASFDPDFECDGYAFWEQSAQMSLSMWLPRDGNTISIAISGVLPTQLDAAAPDIFNTCFAGYTISQYDVYTVSNGAVSTTHFGTVLYSENKLSLDDSCATGTTYCECPETLQGPWNYGPFLLDKGYYRLGTRAFVPQLSDDTFTQVHHAVSWSFDISITAG